MIKYLLLLGLFSGCTTLYEKGKPVFRTSSDLTNVYYKSPNGSILAADKIDNSSVHKAIGTEVVKGITATGAAVYTGGTIFLK